MILFKCICIHNVSVVISPALSNLRLSGHLTLTATHHALPTTHCPPLTTTTPSHTHTHTLQHSTLSLTLSLSQTHTHLHIHFLSLSHTALDDGCKEGTPGMRPRIYLYGLSFSCFGPTVDGRYPRKKVRKRSK